MLKDMEVLLKSLLALDIGEPEDSCKGIPVEDLHFPHK
jgi:hypothetical protein